MSGNPYILTDDFMLHLKFVRMHEEQQDHSVVFMTTVIGDDISITTCPGILMNSFFSKEVCNLLKDGYEVKLRQSTQEGKKHHTIETNGGYFCGEINEE